MYLYTLLQQRKWIAKLYLVNKSIVLTQREFRKGYLYKRTGLLLPILKWASGLRTSCCEDNFTHLGKSLKVNPHTSTLKCAAELNLDATSLRRMLLHFSTAAAEGSETKKATKRVRKPKEVEEVEKSSDESENEAPPVKRQKKTNKTDTKAVRPAPQTKANKPLVNKSSTDYDEIDWNCDKKSGSGKSWNFKVSSWNVDGIRAWLNKGGLDFLKHEKPDILCMQETKCSEKKLPVEIVNIPDYHQYWANGEKEGYAGVGIFSKEKPIKVVYGLADEFDTEGRMITAEYKQFYVICTYVPNSGRGLVTLPKRLEWNKAFKERVKELNVKKPVIICGDMNVSHLEIDLANPKTNKKNAGFTQEERDGLTELLADGFVDTFRKFYPEEIGCYTFWTYMSNCRAKNVGWRLDYGIVSERLMPSVCDNVIRGQVFGSDHCPITLFLHIDDK